MGSFIMPVCGDEDYSLDQTMEDRFYSGGMDAEELDDEDDEYNIGFQFIDSEGKPLHFIEELTFNPIDDEA